LKLLFGLLLLALLIGSSVGVYPAPFRFSDIQAPPIVMPELQTVNISRDFDFPELNFTEFELAADMPPMDIELELAPEIELDPEPEPKADPETETEPAYTYDVYIHQQDQSIIAETADGRQIAALPVTSDAAGLFKAAINATPDGGRLHIGAGHYNLSAPYSFALNPDGSNIFYSAIQVLDKDMVISGEGMDKTVLHLLPGQRSPSRHVAMMLIRGTRGYDPGYESFTVQDLTLDGNRAAQTDGQPHDGEGLILVGSERTNGVYYQLGLKNSWGSGLYLGNNGAGDSGTNEIVSQVVAQNCGAEGIILDTCHNSTVIDCAAWQCREGLVLYGNDDYKARSPDNVSASRFQTDSQVTVWQVNDFTLSNIEMDCTDTTGSYGLMIRDGTGTVKYSGLVSSQTREDSTGGATYILEGSDVLFDNCLIEGYFGVHAIGRSHVEVTNCQIDAPGGCYCMTDLVPVQSTIVAHNNTCTGKELATQEGATFYNF